MKTVLTPQQVDLNVHFEEDRSEIFELAAAVFKYQLAEDFFKKKVLSAVFPMMSEMGVLNNS